MKKFNENTDPKEIKAWNNPINYDPPKHGPDSLDIDWYGEETLGLTEEDSLEAWHQKQANHEKDVTDLYIERQNLMRNLNRSGHLQKLLSPEQYKVFKLAYEYNQTQEEIAQKLNIVQGTVNHHLSRAIQKIQNYFQK